MEYRIEKIEQLMLEKLTGSIGEEENYYLDQLIRQDELIKRQWEIIQQDFEKHSSQYYIQNIDTKIAWQKVTQGVAQNKRNKNNNIKRMAIAASIAIPLLFAGWFYFHSSPNNSSPKIVQQPNRSVKLYINNQSLPINLSQYNNKDSLPALKNINLQIKNGSLSYSTSTKTIKSILNTLVIPPTATYHITLSDGTEVTLNSMSKLKFPFTFLKNKREVYVSGEAYFKVAKDANRPFIVHTPSTTIHVLGTEFNVNTYDSLRVSTSLVSGSVRTIDTHGHHILLIPGQEAVFSLDGTFNMQPFNMDKTLSWMRGVYFFQNHSLKSIAAVVHRWYGDTIQFDSPQVANSRFTGALMKRKPLKYFLNNLSFTSNIRYYSKDGVIHIAAM